ncbi:flavin reductase family protein [Wukongibacter baidiensis]|uniref:flavin reductase family protein n=1 Tax=Wukongibacter baidiensis TaxID=1723361 RepID=UPI003D7FA987
MDTKEKMIKEALKRIANPVTIVTSQRGSIKGATTVAWVTRASNDPPLVMICISPKRFIHDLIIESKEFNLAVLGDESEEMALFCGTNSAYDVDKLTQGNIELLKASLISSPLIKNALVNLECRLMESFGAGDHTVFIGEVIMAHIQKEGKPLVVTDKLCTLDHKWNIM